MSISTRRRPRKTGRTWEANTYETNPQYVTQLHRHCEAGTIAASNTVALARPEEVPLPIARAR